MEHVWEAGVAEKGKVLKRREGKSSRAYKTKAGWGLLLFIT
jgi:hypothetical protein